MAILEEIKESEETRWPLFLGKMEDEEEQTNELLALEAIYDERVFIQSKDEPGGELRIHIEIDQPFTVSFEANAGRNELSEKMSEIEVKYLPPIVLNFSYPPDYPSSAPPLFALSCKWLNEIQVRNIMNFRKLAYLGTFLQMA